jgi:hypothetical protein
MPSGERFHLQWILPLEPGLPTHAALHDSLRPDAEPILLGSGGDEPEALLDLLSKLPDAAPPDAVTCVADAYQKRTGQVPPR